MKGSDIYLFNPTSEMAVANGTVSWQPNQILQQFEEDLSFLPAYFATKEDIVLVKNIPGNAFLEQFQTLNIQLPSFMKLQELEEEVLAKEVLLNSIKPWGWSRVVYWKLKDIWPFCKPEFLDGSHGTWNEKLRTFISREFSLKILKEIISNSTMTELISERNFPVICTSFHEIEKEHSNNKLSIVKLPWSSSGRGLQVINQAQIHPSIKNRLLGAIKQQGFVMVEPMLDKKMDFALHFEVSPNEISYLGKTVFGTSEDGKYAANYLSGCVPSEQQQYFNFLLEREKYLVELVHGALDNSYLKEYYNGFLGVDGMVFLQDNQLNIHPCVEINLRYNMGVLALKLEELISSNSTGIYRQFGGKQGEFHQFVASKQLENPVKIENGKLISGILPLTEPHKHCFFGAYLDANPKD